MKRELGIARCGLACCLCSENERCNGCNSGTCPDFEGCENRKCSLQKELDHCFERNEQNGVVYHRAGVMGDYDDFTDVEALIRFIRTGTR